MQQALIQTTGIGIADAHRADGACLFSGDGGASARACTVRIFASSRGDLSARLLLRADELLSRRGQRGSACIATWGGAGCIELANAGDTIGAIVGVRGVRFLFAPQLGPRQRLWCYVGSGRLTLATIERYTVSITAADRYLVLMTNELWGHLSAPAIERICLEAQTPEHASAALVAAAGAHGEKAGAAAVVIRLS